MSLVSIVKGSRGENDIEIQNTNVKYVFCCKNFLESSLEIVDINVYALTKISAFSFVRRSEDLTVVRFIVKKGHIKNEQIEALIKIACDAREKGSELQENNQETTVTVNKDKLFGLINQITDIFSGISNIRASMTLGYFVANKGLLSKILKLDITSMDDLDLKEKNVFFSADGINIVLNKNFFDCLDMVADKIFNNSSISKFYVYNFHISDTVLFFWGPKYFSKFNDDGDNAIPFKNKYSTIVFQEDFLRKLKEFRKEELDSVCSFINSLSYCWNVTMDGGFSYEKGFCKVFCNFLFDDYAISDEVDKIFESFSQKNILELYLIQKDNFIQEYDFIQRDDFVQEDELEYKDDFIQKDERVRKDVFVVGKESLGKTMKSFSYVKKIFERNRVIDGLKIDFVCSSNEDMKFKEERSKNFIEKFYLDLIKYIFSRNASLCSDFRVGYNKKPFCSNECKFLLKRNKEREEKFRSIKGVFEVTTLQEEKKLFVFLMIRKNFTNCAYWRAKKMVKLKIIRKFQ